MAESQINWRSDQNWQNYNSWRLTGKIAHFFQANSEMELIAAGRDCYQRKTDFLIIGGGTNVLIPDENWLGAVILNHNQDFKIIDAEQGLVYVGSGWPMAGLGQKLVENKLGGLEGFASLPGTLGGAIYNNSHFGGELMVNFLTKIKIYDPKKDKISEIDVNREEFDYDHSPFVNKKIIILGAILKLQPETEEKEMRERIKKVAVWRAKNQPLGEATAGCVFQNVANNDELRAKLPEFADQDYISAGFLIDSSGLKGKQIGNFVVSDKHAAFIVNQVVQPNSNSITDAKSANNKSGNLVFSDRTDLIKLIEKIKVEVKKHWQIDLKEEIFYL